MDFLFTDCRSLHHCFFKWCFSYFVFSGTYRMQLLVCLTGSMILTGLFHSVFFYFSGCKILVNPFSGLLILAFVWSTMVGARREGNSMEFLSSVTIIFTFSVFLVSLFVCFSRLLVNLSFSLCFILLYFVWFSLHFCFVLLLFWDITSSRLDRPHTEISMMCVHTYALEETSS